MTSFGKLVGRVRGCTLCAGELAHAPRPVLQIDPRARILIAGQAPGRKVHESGLPFDDASGERLRDWMGIDRTLFYDAAKFAIVPMGFCYPGTGKSGDLPPRPECAPKWRAPLLSHLRKLCLILPIGQYAHTYHLGLTSQTLTENVRNWRHYGPAVIPLPHPSPRNNIWLKRNPWFEHELLPALKQAVADALAAAP